MFTTVNNVKLYTGKEVALDIITRAQALMEILIGRNEVDIENVSDLMLLDKMTAYQVAYMLENEDLIYKQTAANSVGSGDSMQTFDTSMLAPFMSPLAVIASRGLSFNKTKSVRTGKIFQFNRKADWRSN